MSLLHLVRVVSTPAIPGKKTSQCFVGKLFSHRDSAFDDCLPEFQHDQPESKFLVESLIKPATFKQIVENFLRLRGEDFGVSEQLLLDLEYVTTLPTIESLIKRRKEKENVGIRTDGSGNFFPVEGKNKSVRIVSVRCNARRSASQWDAILLPFNHRKMWEAKHHSLFRK